MKKLICIFVILIFLCPTVNANGVFKDVPENHWAYKYITFFYEKGIISGTSTDTFSPDDLVTREQFAKILNNVFNTKNYVAPYENFSDVTPDMWSYEYINYAKEHLPGYEKADGTKEYRPYDFAIREDIAYALAKACGLYVYTDADQSVLYGFSDGFDVSINRVDLVTMAIQEGWLNGYDDGTIRLKKGVTRAELMTIIYRVLGVDKFEEIEKEEQQFKEEIMQETESYDDGEYAYTVMKLNGIDVDGYIRLYYLDNGKVVISNSGFSFGDGEYTVQIEETESITDDEIVAKFLISLDGELIADSVRGKIVNYKKENMKIITDDGQWVIECELHQ